MFNIILKNIVIHNYEYEYIENVKDVEEAMIYSYFYKYDIFLHFKNENLFWFSKIDVNNPFKTCENNNICDCYINYEFNHLDMFNNNLKNEYDDDILVLIYGDLKFFKNYNFLNDLKNTFDIFFVCKDNEYKYILDNINYKYCMISNNLNNSEDIYKYYNTISIIRNMRYKYILFLNTKIIIPSENNDFIEKCISKLKNTENIDTVITNNIDNMFFCRTITYDKYNQIPDKSKISYLKFNDIILNDI